MCPSKVNKQNLKFILLIYYQGSGLRTGVIQTVAAVQVHLALIAIAEPWLSGHMRDIRVTSIAAGYDVSATIWAVPFGMIFYCNLKFKMLDINTTIVGPCP